ncbi:putative transporter YycB [Leucobacter aridicollis]|uniref:MFS transporter n=1 Tax=Leucobacter aridicollis TaxID=283878 RepID=UPI0037C695ED
MSTPSKRLVWQFVAVFLVALNMRMTIAGVGPLLNDIADSRGVSAGTLGLLASIPLLTWAAVSPFAQTLSARFGMDRTVTLSLVVLALGTVWRSLDFSTANLWLGTVLIGAALAVANVLMPAIVKRDFGPRTPAVMGVYSAALGGAAGIGTAIAIPVSRAEVAGRPLGWEAGLLATGLTIPIALLAWLLIAERGARRAARAAPAAPAPAPRVGRAVWRSKTAWLLACYMGAQSTSFYIFATWIAPIMFSRGASAAMTSTGITLFHICGMLGSLLAPLLLRFDGRSLLQVALPVIQLVGVVGLVLAPSATFVWIVALGLCCGAALSVSLTLIAQRSSDAHTAAAVSGMSQAVGYSIAALGPVLFGWAHDLSGGWALPLVVSVAALTLHVSAGWILRDGRAVRLAN